MRLRDHLHAARRHFRRYGRYALINYASLALGLFCCFSLLTVVDHELRYDDGFAEADRLFRVDFTSDLLLATSTYARGPSALFAHLGGVADVEAAAALIPHQDLTALTPTNEGLVLGGVFYATPAFFNVFDFPFAEGDAARALAEPGAIVLTHATALRLFGRADVVGAPVPTTDGRAFTVAAVLAPDPPLSHLPFEALTYCPPGLLTVWNGMVAATYVRLRPSAAPPDVAGGINTLIQAHAPPYLADGLEASLRAVPSIHLASHLSDELAPNGDLRALLVFAGAALLVLLMAALNFANLTTLHYSGRGPEVGVRKAFGARRRQLVGQFLGETSVLAGLAGVTALVLVVAFRPWILSANGVVAEADRAMPIPLVAAVVLLGLFVGVASGLYPAVALSVASPLSGLRRERRVGKAAARVRRGFLTSQLVVALTFVVASATVVHQLRFLAEKDLGYDPDGVYTLRLPGDVTPQRYELLKRALLQRADVDVVSYGSLPGEGTGGLGVDGPDGEPHLVHRYLMGPDYLEALGMDLLRGRPPREAPGVFGGGDEMLLNRHASLLLHADATSGAAIDVDGKRRDVTGVVGDFHFYSLDQPIVPVYAYDPGRAGPHLILRLRGPASGRVLDEIRALCGRFLPDSAYPLVSLEQRLSAAYVDEERLAGLLGSFSAVALLLAFLGVHAVNAYTLERRRKELGIRLVLGASFGHLYRGLLREGVMACALAGVVSFGVAYAFWTWWGAEFAYRAGFPYGSAVAVYACTVALTLVVAWARTREAMAIPPAAVVRES